MIRVIINGKRAFPVFSSEVKMTVENPFIKDRDKWTMEFRFPLDIIENLSVFGHIDRLEVTKQVRSFSDCMVTDGRRVIIRGVGIVTQVRETEVCLQIKSGMQKIAYRSDFERVYIDQIDYDSGDILAILQNTDIPLEIRQVDGFGRWAFPTVYDETGGVVLNTVRAEYVPKAWAYTGENVPPTISYSIQNAAVQPSMKFVLKEVIRHMGYTANIDDFGEWVDLEDATDGLGNIFICNNRVTVNMAKALPHWTVKKFIDELSNLLNITFVFDDAKATVHVKKSSSVLAQDVVSYECVDGFTTESEEEGLAVISSANIQYNLAGSSYRSGEDIPDDVLDAFEVRSYEDYPSLETAALATGDEGYRIIFSCPQGFFYLRVDGGGNRSLKKAKFQHIRRNENAKTVTLNIAPVAMGNVESEHYRVVYRKWAEGVSEERAEQQGREIHRWETETALWSIEMPCVTSKARSGNGATVQQAVEENASVREEEDELMEVMYLSRGHVAEIKHIPSKVFIVISEGSGGAYQYVIGNGAPAYLRIPTLLCETDKFQFYDSQACIGVLHPRNATLEGRVPVTIKFLSDEIPDPTKVYLFRGKLFLCDKIEQQIGEQGVGKLKTGYFYEIIS